MLRQETLKVRSNGEGRRLSLCWYDAAVCGAAMRLALRLVRSAQGRVAPGDQALELVDPTSYECAPIRTICRSPTRRVRDSKTGSRYFLPRNSARSLRTPYFPQATGFVRMTLGSHRCDVIMGYPQGDEMVQNTNPYYETAYALLTKGDSPLDAVERLPIRAWQASASASSPVRPRRRISSPTA